MDDCLRYALVSGKKALEQAGLGMETDAFKALNKQRCVAASRAGRAAAARRRRAGGSSERSLG